MSNKTLDEKLKALGIKFAGPDHKVYKQGSTIVFQNRKPQEADQLSHESTPESSGDQNKSASESNEDAGYDLTMEAVKDAGGRPSESKKNEDGE